MYFFDLATGDKPHIFKTNEYLSLVVRDGEVTAVPVSAAAILVLA